MVEDQIDAQPWGEGANESRGSKTRWLAPSTMGFACIGDLRATPDPATQDPNKAATLTQLGCD
jgi:hypothetical protein